MRIDLHTHSSASDGTERPAELVRAAAAAGLDVVALTDHDTTLGWAEAAEALPSGADAGARRRDLLPRTTGSACTCWPTCSTRRTPSWPPRCRWRWTTACRGPGDRREAGRRRVPGDLGAVLDQLAGRRDRRPAAHRRRAGGRGCRRRPQRGVRDAAARRRAVLRRPLRRRRRCGGRLVRAAGGVPVFAHPRRGCAARVVGDDAIRALAAAGLAGLEVDHRDHAPGRPGAAARPGRPSWACWSPAPATTTAPASATGSARTPPTRRCSRRCSARSRSGRGAGST